MSLELSRRELTPLVAAAVLSALLVLQFVLPSGTTLPDDPAVAPRRLRGSVASPVQSYATLTADDVFAPDRRPGGPAGRGAAEDGALAGPLDGATVLGAASGGRGAQAIVRDPAGSTVLLRPGQTLMGWRVAAIAPRAVTFERGGVRRVLIVGVPAGAPRAPSAKPANDPSSEEPSQ